MSIQVSIIATTYNQSEDLDCYLHSLRDQQYSNFEIIIADDGSKADTASVIRRHQKEFFTEARLIHVWHDDVGYRKSKILNHAIRKSRGDWLIFTDSDLIVHPSFVSDHLRYRAKNTIFMGRRVDLGEEVSNWIRKNPLKRFSAEFYVRLALSAFGDKPTSGVRKGFRILNRSLAKFAGSFKVTDLLGSNFSIDRDTLFRVNGFNETHEHYWGEDGDLFVRVRNIGAAIIGRKNIAIQYHLWHSRREPKPDAEAQYKKSLEDRSYTFCKNGLVQAD
jgi:glycosyltransferase involved in cell wall biosynthesis